VNEAQKEVERMYRRLTNAEGIQNDWKRIRSLRENFELTHQEICEFLVEHVEFDSFIDVGIGTVGSESWSIRQMRPECNIVGFEPSEPRYKLITEVGYPGKIYNCALSSKSGFIEGGIPREDGRNDFCTNANEMCYEMNLYDKGEIECKTIDEIIEEEKMNNALIWADVEGAELDVLKGASKSLKEKKISGIWVELNYELDMTQTNFCHATEVVEFLESYGYCKYATKGPALPDNFKYQQAYEIVYKNKSYKFVNEGLHRDWLFKPTDENNTESE